MNFSARTVAVLAATHKEYAELFLLVNWKRHLLKITQKRPRSFVFIGRLHQYSKPLQMADRLLLLRASALPFEQMNTARQSRNQTEPQARMSLSAHKGFPSFLIYGPVGVGKTHIAQALGR
jgi:hypothetical protein